MNSRNVVCAPLPTLNFLSPFLKIFVQDVKSKFSKFLLCLSMQQSLICFHDWKCVVHLCFVCDFQSWFPFSFWLSLAWEFLENFTFSTFSSCRSLQDTASIHLNLQFFHNYNPHTLIHLFIHNVYPISSFTVAVWIVDASSILAILNFFNHSEIISVGKFPLSFHTVPLLIWEMM